MAKCKGKNCGAEIMWCTWRESGAAIPIDPKPNAAGNLARIGDKVHAYSENDARLHREKFMPHHATCPDAAMFRRK